MVEIDRKLFSAFSKCFEVSKGPCVDHQPIWTVPNILFSLQCYNFFIFDIVFEIAFSHGPESALKYAWGIYCFEI